MSPEQEMSVLIPNDAAAWFGRRRVAGLTEAEEHEFAAWFGQSAENREAYDALVRTWRDVEPLRGDPRVMALREQALRRNRPWRRWSAPMAMAASLLVVVFGGWLAYDGGLWGGREFHTRSYRTGVGEQTTVVLPDGSQVTLNTDTLLRTEAARGRRLVHLDKGQAFFKVAKDASHPFVVSAAGRTVTALGTAFEVRVDPGHFEVTLVEGKVRVEAPLPELNGARRPAARGQAPARVQATEMAPGTQLLADNDTAWRLQEVDPRRETSWTKGQLVFLREPMGSVVEELNRYSETKIVIADAQLAALPITGTFKPGDNEGFAAAVTSYGMARATTQGGAIRLSTPPGA